MRAGRINRFSSVVALLLALPATQADASTVHIVEHDGAYRLEVDGAPFRIKGAGLGDGSIAELAARGGNAFRTWRTLPDPAAQIAQLDQAQQHGLKVALGIEVGNERHGFDYDDEDAVTAQLQRIRAEVQRYKAHPALLMWVVGNELNLHYSNPKVWDAIGQIAREIHAIDPDHPVTTTLAGFDRPLIDLLKQRAPALDLISVQLYGDIVALPDKLRDSGWAGPYVVTEWGPTGHWESPLTTWKAPIEDDSARKAELLTQRYRDVIDTDQRQGLGSFVFLWGDKQERTPTWYGLFLPTGEATPGVDAMQAAWTGRWPVQRAPALSDLTLDGRHAVDSITLKPAQQVSAQVRSSAATVARWRWYVLRESTATSIGGDPETVPARIEVAIADAGDGRIRITAPTAPGHYRLFVEGHGVEGHSVEGHGVEGHGSGHRAGYANLPFRVTE